MSLSRKYALVFLLVPFFTAACEMPAPFKVKDKSPRADVDAPFDPPNTYPGWAYDGPHYVKPAEDLSPEPKAKPDDPLHYFTKEKIVMVRQPMGYTPEEIPRVAIWWSDNNGFHWQKAGYFGREQSFFPFEVDDDGDYGIRFVGPGQEQAMHALAYPERVYHVDTTLPEVEIAVDPEQSWYNVGQNVTVSWRAEDYHLIEMPVNLTALLDFSADESKPIEIQKNLAKEGSITYQIPSESLNHELRFRVDAIDRATNLGIAYSFALQIVSEPVDHPEPQQLDASAEDGIVWKEQSPIEDPTPAPVEQIVAKDSPALEPLPEEIIEEDDSQFAGSDRRPMDQHKHGAVPFATEVARRPVRQNQRTIAAINPEPEAETAATPYQFPSDSRIQRTAPAEHPKQDDDGDPLSMLAPATPRQSEPVGYEWVLLEGPRHDLTQGNRLLVPLPATFSQESVDRRTALAHPWRELVRSIQEPMQTVWSLPRTRFMEASPYFSRLFLANGASTAPLGEPGRSESRVVGIPPSQTEDTPVP